MNLIFTRRTTNDFWGKQKIKIIQRVTHFIGYSFGTFAASIVHYLHRTISQLDLLCLHCRKNMFAKIQAENEEVSKHKIE